MGKPRKWFVENLAPAIADSFTWADVCRKLNLNPLSGSQTHLKKRAIILGIDFTHFQGKSWPGHRKFGPRRPIEFYLTEHSTIASDLLKKKLFRAGLKQKQCEHCNGIMWLGQPIPLELHHINSVHDDNRLENLKVLCPNCHAVEERVCESGGTEYAAGLDPAALTGLGVQISPLAPN